MDLLLIRPNDQKNIYGETSQFRACEPPFWAMMIGSYIREKGFSVDIIDAEVEDLSPDKLSLVVKEKNPLLVGIIVTGTNLSASTWKMEGAQHAVKTMREKDYKGSIFFWGLHPSALPEATLREAPIDFVVKGEGFQSIELLINEIKSGRNLYNNIDGLYYYDKNEIKGNERISLVSDISNLPMQAFDLVPMEKYCAHNWQRFGEKEKNAYAVIATSLGCPFNCSFCAVSTLFGVRSVRFKAPEKVIEEIDFLVKNYKTHYIKILDECFVLNREHVEKICDLLIKRSYDLNIWAYARVDTIDKDLTEKLAKAGFKWLALGIESINQNVLQNVSKGQYTYERIKNTINMIHNAGIEVIANYMFGLPEDNLDSMQETLNFARKVNCAWVNFYTTMAYPGSKLYYDCVAQKIALPESWNGYSQYSYECIPLSTKHITAKEVLAFRDYAFNAFFENNEQYFNMMKKKFGESAVKEIESMLSKKLRRKLLE